MSRKHDAVLRLLADLAVNCFTITMTKGDDTLAKANIHGSISIDELDELIRFEYGCQVSKK